jgi:exodeoxyribonuclease-3
MKKILNLNVNGIRSAIQKGLLDFIQIERPDYITFQEVKINDDNFFKSITFFHNYHLVSNYASNKGYSGVVTLSIEQPIQFQTKFQEDLFDKEGRLTLTEYEKFFIINVYFPSGTMGEHRQEIKDKFLIIFQKWVLNYKFTKPYIILGDFNIAHQEIDIHYPKGLSKTSGFLPHDRQWFTQFLTQNHVDLFRYFYPDKVQYSWFSYRSNAKKNNKGWRIDYAICNKIFCNFVKDFFILNDKNFSDHQPLICILEI